MIVGKRYVSEPLEIPELEGEAVSGADLVFYGVDHSWRSYVADVFVGPEPVDSGSPATPEAGHAGSFSIFGHGGCFGGIGHCDVVERPVDAFDDRPPHPLEGATITVDVSEAGRAGHRGARGARRGARPAEDRARPADSARRLRPARLSSATDPAA
jgi:hypothetical protein